MRESDMGKILELLNSSDRKNVVDTLMGALTPEQKNLVNNAVKDEKTAKALLETPEAKMILDILKKNGKL